MGVFGSIPHLPKRFLDLNKRLFCEGAQQTSFELSYSLNAQRITVHLCDQITFTELLQNHTVRFLSKTFFIVLVLQEIKNFLIIYSHVDES